MRPGAVLALGLGLTAFAATAPAGLGGEPVPGWSWLVWLLAFAAGAHGFRRGGSTLAQGARRVAWLLPFVLMLALPAALLAASADRATAALALVLEAALVGLRSMVERASAMLRARAARRGKDGAWGLLLREPGATLRGFGRFGAALLLRTLERAEAQERARVARGADLA